MTQLTTYNLQLTTGNLIGFLVLLFVVWGWLLVGASPVLAQTEYQPLAPLPDIPTNKGKITASSYITGVFMLVIAVASGLAVVMIIVGGIQYMSTDAFSGKSEAKNTIQNAIWGLLLAISAWLILNTINPKLVNFNLEIPTPRNSNSTTAPSASPQTPPSTPPAPSGDVSEDGF
jgi:hypothetical protein